MLVLSLALGLSVSCARSDTTPVARGEYYAAGHPDYDEFFVRLYRYQLETNADVKREEALRGEVAPALEAGSPDPALKERADELKKVEQKALANVAEIDRLRVRAVELERLADGAFRIEGAAKQSEVKQNLGDARELLVLMSDRQKAIAQSSGELARKLAQAFPEAPPPVATTETPEPAPKKARKSRGRGTSKPKPQAAGPVSPPPPKPAPAKPAASKPDFEP